MDDRDRASEFLAAGTIAELERLTDATKNRLAELAPQIARATELHLEPELQNSLAADWTVGAALIHAYEELAQHLGHLELTVDVILAGESGEHS